VEVSQFIGYFVKVIMLVITNEGTGWMKNDLTLIKLAPLTFCICGRGGGGVKIV
jgi:hypothetical protein